MKKKIIMYLGMLFLAFAGVGASAAATPTDTSGVYETDKGIQITINDPGKQNYTGITPDEPESGYDVFTQQNADVGVKVTYDAEADETTYLYGYNMYLPRTNRYGYWSFDLGNNKITKNDDFDFYVVNMDTQQEYLVNDMENKDPSSFSIYIKNRDYGTGGCMSKTYQLKIVVKGNKTTTMNGIDIIEELSGENACFGECGGEAESPCSIPTSNSVYNYFYYTFDTDENNNPIATTAQEKWEEYISKYGYDNPYDYQMEANYYLMDDILKPEPTFNHEGHLYKHRMNCSYFLYTKQNANYPDVYVNGIFEQGLLWKYFYSSDVKDNYCGVYAKECGKHHKYKYDYATYLKNGHTSQIEYYTLSLKYTYKVYTPKNYEEISFKGYMDRVANQIGEYIDKAYENGVHSCDELIASLNQQITTLNNTVASKTQEISSLQNQLNDKNSQIVSQQSLLGSKNKELAALEKELAGYKNQVSVLTSQIQEKESQLTYLLIDTNAKTEEIASLQSLIDGKNKELTSYKNQVSSLTSELQEKESQLANLLKDTNAKTEEIASLQSLIDGKNKELTSYKNQVSSLTSEIQEKESRLSNLLKENNAKTEEIASLRNSINTLTTLNEATNSKLQETEANKINLEANITSLNQQITSLKSDADAKQNNINSLNKEVQDLKKQITEKESEVSTLERVIGFRDDKISSLEKEKEDNKFFSTNGYWKKLFNFKDAEHWNVYNWLTWIGLGFILIVAFIVFVKKKK